MCYFNGQKVARAEYIRLKQLEKLVANYDFLSQPLHIGFDYEKSAVLKPVEGKEDFEIVQMEWGFIPEHLRTRDDVSKMRMGYKDNYGQFRPPIITLNAVCEELLFPNKIYRPAALNRRILVLSAGFYEWRHLIAFNKKTGQPLKTTRKIPYFITLKDRDYFYMAGIWTPWTDKITGEYVESYAVVTTAANKLMEEVHNSKMRMPTILNDDLAYEWMFGKLSEERILEIASSQYPAEQMQAYTIQKDFKSMLDPTEKFEYEDVPALAINL